ncbi:metal ABC transporter permease [Pokkaliibacter sp. CJK22405]|uniref:metal ABC transporter permease n=1 Tax=Pokkaliibacter sp. CJK22405 TaxID=3384615 RepID=UPI00398513EA
MSSVVMTGAAHPGLLELIYQWCFAPFAEFGFMRRALVATLALGLGAGPVGVLLMLRRMSLMGDALSHAVLPGAAFGYMLAGGLSLPMMGAGALLAGVVVALGSGLISRMTLLREDAAFASIYLVSLALGVLMISGKGSNLDLLHILFGSILAIDSQALELIAAITSGSLIIFALIYRPLVMECFDPAYLRAVGGRGFLFHLLFLLLLVLTLVAGFQTLGTLMSVGMMILPAVIARLWARTLPMMIGIAVVMACLSGYLGLLVSYHLNYASGPCIILMAATLYFLSLIVGPAGPARRLFPQRLYLPSRLP